MAKPNPSSNVRRWTTRGLLAALAVGLGVAVVLTQAGPGNPVEAAQVEQPAADAGLDLLTYSRVQQARREAGLTNTDLALLGVSDAEASAVLSRLVQWCRSNEAGLLRARQAVNTARGGLREQQRLVRIGQASERQLKDADGKAKAVAEAVQARADLIKSGAAYAMESVPGKASAWQNASGLKSRLDSDLRYLSGMDTDRLEALYAEAGRLGVTLEQALFVSEQQELAALRDQARASMPAVLVGEAVGLPLPEELRDEALLVGEPSADAN